MRRLTAWQSPVFLVNSRLGLFAAAASRSRGKPVHDAAAPLLPKLRGSFAEFLCHSSPDRLGMFYPPTCVGFGTGPARNPQGLFLGAWAHRLRLKASSAASGARRARFAARRPTRPHGDVQNPARLPFSVTPSVKLRVGGAGMSTRCASATRRGLALAPD